MGRTTRAQLLTLLADGRFHSGQQLAASTGITRTAVWKHVHALRQCGLDIHAVTGKGYRLAAQLDLLGADAIRTGLQPETASHIRSIDVQFALPSTNQHLLAQSEHRDIHGHVCLAEYQSAGMGRRGHQWLSPIAAGLYLSLGWRTESLPEPVTGLSLAAGVAVSRALRACGIDNIGLKWPNDLVHAGAKLGGILVQIKAEAGGPCVLILGVGINVRLPAGLSQQLDQPVTDLAALGRVPGRNHLAAALLDELVACLHEYPQQGFAAYRGDWQRHDCMAGRNVTLSAGEHRLHGKMAGVDDDGALLLEVDGKVRRYAAGELSLRAVPG